MENLWQQFVLVAGAHFLALLSPGPDFVLVVRTRLGQGFGPAAAACLGIALANAVYIALAAGGFALLQRVPQVHALLKWGGCLWLVWLGWQCLRHPASGLPGQLAPASTVAAGRAMLAGCLCALLNPKNALFYTGLFAALADQATPPAAQVFYGAWMVSLVLLWDLTVARLAGRPEWMRRWGRHVPRLERATGALLLTLAAGMVVQALA